jgi:hypothetical protein
MSPSEAPAPRRDSILRMGNPRKPPRFSQRHVKRVAATGYKLEQQRLREQAPPPEVIVALTRYALLRMARLPKKGTYSHKIDAALERLCKNVGYRGEAPDSAPLLDWAQRGHHLELRVSGEWLEKPFLRVVLPLPLRGATALGLYLFLHACTDGGEIPRGTLCDRLGIPNYGKARDDRALQSALDIVNAHLNGFSNDYCRALLDANIDLAERWEMSDTEGVIAFTALRVALPELDDEANAADDDDDGASETYADDDAETETDGDDEAPIKRRRFGQHTDGDDEAPIKRRRFGKHAISGGDIDDREAEDDDRDAPVKKRPRQLAIALGSELERDADDDGDDDPERWEDYEWRDPSWDD